MNKTPFRFGMLLWASASSLAAQTTVQNTTYNAGQTLTVSDPIVIIASPNVVVSSGANIIFSAPGEIILGTGYFLAANGSTFTAMITGQVASLQQTTTTSSSASISWNGISGSIPISYYNIFRNGTFLGSNGAGILSFADSSLNSNTAYAYTVMAIDTKGNITATSVINVNTPGPSGSLNGYQVILMAPGGQFYGIGTNWTMASVTPH